MIYCVPWETPSVGLKTLPWSQQVLSNWSTNKDSLDTICLTMTRRTKQSPVNQHNWRYNPAPKALPSRARGSVCLSSGDVRRQLAAPLSIPIAFSIRLDRACRLVAASSHSQTGQSSLLCNRLNQPGSACRSLAPRLLYLRA